MNAGLHQTIEIVVGFQKVPFKNIRYLMQYELNGKFKKKNIVIPITPYMCCSDTEECLEEGNYIQKQMDLSMQYRGIVNLNMLLKKFI